MENENLTQFLQSTTPGTGHITFNDKVCPKCASTPDKHEVRNYDPIWRDGDVYCTVCGAFVRTYDAG